MESLRVERAQWSQSWGDLFIRVYSLLYCRGLCLLQSSFSKSGISFHKACHNWLLHLSTSFLLAHKAEMCTATPTSLWGQTNRNLLDHIILNLHVSALFTSKKHKRRLLFLLSLSASLLLNSSSLLTVIRDTIQCIWPLTSGWGSPEQETVAPLVLSTKPQAFFVVGESSCNDDKSKACAWVNWLLLLGKKGLQTATFAFLLQHKVSVVLFGGMWTWYKLFRTESTRRISKQLIHNIRTKKGKRQKKRKEGFLGWML